MSSNDQKRILIAPLDWGLGHTTRCVPLIRWLQTHGHEVVFAGNDSQRSFITGTFPGLDTRHLDGYNIRYSRSRIGFSLAIMQQVPGILRRIKDEHHWLAILVEGEHFDGIISDNRYGLYHAQVPSVIMTHQLQVLSGMGGLMDELLRTVHYRYLERFGTCWVVDVKGTTNLSGKLAHPRRLPSHTRYIGLLSQFEQQLSEGPETHQLMLLSGPEPQRSILSKKLWALATASRQPTVFVEGSDSAVRRDNIPGHITYHGRLAAGALEPLIQQASLVFCRSGYSTLMDLLALGKKAVVIPTPGQTEQEYLARHTHGLGLFFRLPQSQLPADPLAGRLKEFPFSRPDVSGWFTQYRQALAEWVKQL